MSRAVEGTCLALAKSSAEANCEHPTKRWGSGRGEVAQSHVAPNSWHVPPHPTKLLSPAFAWSCVHQHLSLPCLRACCPLLAFCSMGSTVQIPDPSLPGIVTQSKLLNLRFHIHRRGEIIAPISEGTVRDTAVSIGALESIASPHASCLP